jgi:hypothetical protein
MAGHDEAGYDGALPDLRRMMAVRVVWLYERLRASSGSRSARTWRCSGRDGDGGDGWTAVNFANG